LRHAASAAVITHGEPHPGSLIRVEGGFALVGWDTVALDRAERDLWMLDDEALTMYQRRTGGTVDPAAVTFFRLGWALADLAAFTTQLRAPHLDSADTRHALTAIRQILAAEEPAPYGRRPV
jgi:spectinomycin phosphotransferase